MMPAASPSSDCAFSRTKTRCNKEIWASKMSFFARKWYQSVPSSTPADSAMAAVVSAPYPFWLNAARLEARILSRVFSEKSSSVPGVSSPLFASVMGQLRFHGSRDPWVHYVKPQWGNHAQQNGRRVSQRQRWAFFMAIEHLILLR